MATKILAKFPDRAGVLADVGQRLGAEGVNLAGVTGTTEGVDDGLVAFIVDDDAAAAIVRSTLEIAGGQVVSEREVVIVACEDRPGQLGEVTRKVADAGVNLDHVSLATGTRLVLGSPDIAALRKAVEAS